MNKPALVLAAALAAGPAAAIELSAPIACPDGGVCYIQSLVDRDPGPGVRDFACGAMTYDGHQGVDFRVSTMAELRRGVDILAAAPGVVRAVRDGESDDGIVGMTPGRDCGNGVVVDHGDGWTTQYCHMAFGGVHVSANERVAAGQRLGLMGFSGRTEFPHLHFTLRRNGRVIDPFDARPASASCEAADKETLWADPPALSFGGLVDQGFTGARLTLEQVRDGLPEQGFKASDGVLIFWMRAYALRPKDTLDLRLTGPDGAVLAENTRVLDRHRAEEFAYIGVRRPSGGWRPGDYLAVVEMTRSGAPFESRRIRMRVP